MGEALLRVKKINRLMVIVFWVTTALQTLFTAFVIETPTLKNWVIVSIIASIAITITILDRYEKYINILQYLMMLFLPVISIIFTVSFFDLNGLITIYLAIILVALYQDYRLVLVSAFLCSLSLYYGYINGGETMLGNFNNTSGIINIYFTLILFTYFVVMNCRSSKQLIDESTKEKLEKEASNEQISAVLSVTKEAVESLTAIEKNLSDEIVKSNEIAGSVNDNFKDIGRDTETQNSALESLQRDIQKQVMEINKVVEANQFVGDFTSSTNEMSEDAQNNLAKLSSEMTQMGVSSNASVKLIEEFLENVKKVTSVLETIKQISEQINLLSLNASIEAARAGEHGRGFAVVAEEVGKLAIESKESNVEIEEILNGIVSQSNTLYKDIDAINSRIDKSIGETDGILKTFSELKSGAVKAKDHAGSALNQAAKAERYSQEFASQVDGVMEISSESAHTVKNSLEMVERQSDAMAIIVEKSNELQEVINTMKDIL